MTTSPIWSSQPFDGPPIDHEDLKFAVGVFLKRRLWLSAPPTLFHQGIIDLALLEAIVTAATPPPSSLVTKWLRGVELELPKIFEHIRSQLRRHYRLRSRQELDAAAPLDGHALQRLRRDLSDVLFPDGAPWTAKHIVPPDRNVQVLIAETQRYVCETAHAQHEASDWLTDEDWALMVWSFIKQTVGSYFDFHAWVLAQVPSRADSPSAPDVSEPPPSSPNNSGGDVTLSCNRPLRAQIVRFFGLQPLLDKLGSALASSSTALSKGFDMLTCDEIRRCCQVECLLAAVTPGLYLLPSRAYSFQLFRAVQAVLDSLPTASSPIGEILRRLRDYYARYEAWLPPLILPFADAKALWFVEVNALAAKGHPLLRQKATRAILERAFAFAVTPEFHCGLTSHVCGSDVLVRQWDSERVGLALRNRADMHSEFGIVAFRKLGTRVAALETTLARGPLPSDVFEAGIQLTDAVRELANVCRDDDPTRDEVSCTAELIYNRTIEPEFTQMAARLASFSQRISDPEVHCRLVELRCRARRVAWTAEDVVDGFLRVRRNIGLRWLLAHRGRERWDDILSPT